MARPSKLTPETKDRIVAAIRAGNYAEPAARSAGISEATYHRWMKRGERESKGIYRDFYEEVRRAEADAEVEAVARLRKAMPDDWRACLSYLERRYTERWGRRRAHEHTGAGGAPLRLAQVMFEDDETRKALDEALKAAGRARASGSGGPGDGQ
jgi:transposase-like protein